MSTITELIARLRSFAKLSEAMEKRVGQKKGDLTKILFEAADTIEALRMKLSASLLEQDILHGGWIPCDERLPEHPENDDYYLVTIQCEHYDGWDDYVTGFAEWTKGGWDELSCYVGQIKVVAWRPLPEPFSGKTGKERKDNG